MRIEPPVISPTTLPDAFRALSHPGCRPLAGGTDLYVQLTAEIGQTPSLLVDLWGIEALRGIEVVDGFLRLGPLTTFAEIGRSAVCRAQVPALVEAGGTVGAVQIQNRATIGGNVMNASPAGDSLPVLLALDAQLVIGGPGGERTVAALDFWTSYRTTALRRGELLVGVRIPLKQGREQRFRKVGTRRAQAISKVVLAMAWEVTAAGAWANVRVAFGSVAATPVRVPLAEQCLEGSRPDRATADRAIHALGDELHPIDDVRSTAAYRKEVARRIVYRFFEPKADGSVHRRST